MHWPAAYADFNVFRRRLRPSLCCAVRQDWPVPDFLHGDIWEFNGTVTSETPPPGFRSTEAHEAMRTSGYYLFRVES